MNQEKHANCFVKSNLKISEAQTNMETVNSIFQELSQRKLGSSENDTRVKISQIANELQMFVDDANGAMRSNNLYMSSIQPRKGKNNNKQMDDFEEPFLENQQQEVEVKVVLEQYDKVKERHEDVLLIEGTSKNVNQLAKNMLNLTVDNDLKLTGIVKQHVEHERKIEKEINPQFARTKEIQVKMLKKICCLGGIALILVTCMVLLIYFALKK